MTTVHEDYNEISYKSVIPSFLILLYTLLSSLDYLDTRSLGLISIIFKFNTSASSSYPNQLIYIHATYIQSFAKLWWLKMRTDDCSELSPLSKIIIT